MTPTTTTTTADHTDSIASSRPFVRLLAKTPCLRGEKITFIKISGYVIDEDKFEKPRMQLVASASRNAVYKLTLCDIYVAANTEIAVGGRLQIGLSVAELIVNACIIQGFNPVFIINSYSNIKGLPEGAVPWVDFDPFFSKLQNGELVEYQDKFETSPLEEELILDVVKPNREQVQQEMKVPLHICAPASPEKRKLREKDEDDDDAAFPEKSLKRIRWD